MARARGAKLSPRHRLAAAMPHMAVSPTPSQIIYKPVQLSFWLNETDGDCVTAEEAFAKACHDPEIFITDDTVKVWATKNDLLNGANLTDVLDLMQSTGFPQDGVVYNDGPYNSVDWTNAEVLKNAIAQGPVKIAVAADQLEKVVPNPPTDGWFATGFSTDRNIDHCVSLCGFGSVEWLAGQLGIPSGGEIVDGIAPGYAMFTWDSIGIIDVPSLLAICGEAWLRVPVTVIAS